MEADALLDADRVHVCTTQARSGIAAYAEDFQRVVLGPEGYVLATPDEVLRAGAAFRRDTRFHIQLGIFQHRERLAMSGLLSHGYRDIEATIHDPPFLTFPFFQFRSKLMMRLSRGFDWYLGSFGIQRRAIERLSRIFVLSEAGRRALLDYAPKANVFTIPFVIPANRIPPPAPLGQALLFFGFIGPGKGLEYALQLHRAVQQLRPGVQLHVVGQPIGAAAERYLAKLKSEVDQSVTFHGYVPDDQLDAMFERAGHVILPFAAYKYVVPASSSIVNALRRGRIVWTTDVNAIRELIEDGKNGFLLSMDVDTDARRLAAVLNDEALARSISDGARRSAFEMAHYPYREHFAR